jgi:hypothetical protein
MKGLVEHHLDSVPLAKMSREQLRAEIISGMTATWHLVSPQFQLQDVLDTDVLDTDSDYSLAITQS